MSAEASPEAPGGPAGTGTGGGETPRDIPEEEPARGRGTAAEPTPATRGLRPPHQERSRRTLRRIVDAGLELVEERGVEGASVQAIVDRAERSVGSFYARFDGKADLIRYLEHRVWSEARERWDAAVAEGSWSDASLHDLVAGLVRLTLRIERTDLTRRGLGRGRAGDGEVAAGDEPASEAGAFRRHIASDVRRLLLARRDEIDHPRPELAVEVLFRVLLGAGVLLGAAGPAGAPGPAAGPWSRGERDDEPEAVGLDDDAWAAELTRLALAYLGHEERDRPEEEAMDFFDVWA